MRAAGWLALLLASVRRRYRSATASSPSPSRDRHDDAGRDIRVLVPCRGRLGGGGGPPVRFSWTRGLWVDGTPVSEQDFPSRLAELQAQRHIDAAAARVQGTEHGIAEQARGIGNSLSR